MIEVCLQLFIQREMDAHLMFFKLTKKGRTDISVALGGQ